jgi:two-component system, cell cycle response regulator
MTERMRVCIQKNKYGEAVNITCSFGLVSLQKDEDAEAFVQRADTLLYEAKRRGKNTVAYDVCENLEQAAKDTALPADIML